MILDTPAPCTPAFMACPGQARGLFFCLTKLPDFFWHDYTKGRTIVTARGTEPDAYHDTARTYVFMSQRSERLTEEAIHYWFRMLKAQAMQDQWGVIQDLTFHDLRHDFAQRAREGGWSLEEVAHYLGHVSKTGVLPTFW